VGEEAGDERKEEGLTKTIQTEMQRWDNTKVDSGRSPLLFIIKAYTTTYSLRLHIHIRILRFPCCTFDHSSYSKNLWKCKNNYDINIDDDKTCHNKINNILINFWIRRMIGHDQ
jgi:hypothetical protein